MATRSFISSATARRQPSPSVPSRFSAGMRTSVKNTSLKLAAPVIWRSGLGSMPGVSMSTMNFEMAAPHGRRWRRPLCLGASGLVRAMRMPIPEWWAPDVHTFWPLTTNSSPSRTARVCSDATSEPAPGSE
jgi:hypothetical protein